MNQVLLLINNRSSWFRSYKTNIALSFIICITSCNTIHKSYPYNYHTGSIYYNSDLDLSASFFGDIQFYNPEEVSKKHLKELSLSVRKKDLLVYGKSNVPPFYESFIFAKAVLEKKQRISDSARIVSPDTTNGQILVRRQVANQNITMAIKSVEIQKNTTTILKDGLTILNSVASGKPQSELNYTNIFNTYKDADNPLLLKDKFATAPIDPTRKNQWTKMQYLLTLFSLDTEYEAYQSLLDSLEDKRKRRLQPVFDQIQSIRVYQIKNLQKKIKTITEGVQVVMLNEMHWKPEHRTMAAQFLQPLKDQGFTHVAVEAVLKDKQAGINERGYPLTTTGFYTREPYFGLFLRKAHQLGFTIIGYDDFEAENREKAQAKNIATVLKKDPAAKIFVYAGIDHILESRDTTSSGRMADEFKKMTQIDPLTIDQVELLKADQNSYLFESELFQDQKEINTNVDFFLVHSVTPKLEDSFPAASITPFQLQDEVLKAYDSQEVLVKLYDQEEYAKYRSFAVPILQRIKRVKNGNIILDIPKGNYTIVIKNTQDKSVLKKSNVAIFL